MPRPPRASTDLDRFIEDLSPGERLVKLRPHPVEGAEPRECTNNVELAAMTMGGQPLYGRRLLETLPGLLVEAEFHAVLETEGGELVCVTPPELPEIKRIGFLPDRGLRYEGQQIKTEFLALSSDQIILDYIAANEEFFELINEGDLADFHGALRLTPEMQQAQSRIHGLGAAIMRKYFGGF